MEHFWRRLDNTAKIFSLEEKKNNNKFRLSVILNEKVEPNILKLSLIKTLDEYPSYKVKIKTGLFWNYLETNLKEPIIEEENESLYKNINSDKNNEYLFKVTYFNNKINLDILHVLTDGAGATIFLKGILCNYLNLKYNLEIKDKMVIKNNILDIDENIKNADKNLVCDDKYKKVFIIKEKTDVSNNKTYHYIIDLDKFKNICKKHNASVTEYLTAIYIYSIYKTVYDKNSNKDVIVTIPIDLRKYYQVNCFSNFFTCMNIEGNIKNNISFNKILNQVHKEFQTKLTHDKIKKYLARDVRLGTNVAIRLTPLFIKKLFIKYMNKFISRSTATLSNIGQIKVEEQHKEYINNILILVSTSKTQKTKCTVCSYENKLNITLNSNIIDGRLEEEFHRLLKKYIGEFKLESNIN